MGEVVLEKRKFLEALSCFEARAINTNATNLIKLGISAQERTRDVESNPQGVCRLSCHVPLQGGTNKSRKKHKNQKIRTRIVSKASYTLSKMQNYTGRQAKAWQPSIHHASKKYNNNKSQTTFLISDY